MQALALTDQQISDLRTDGHVFARGGLDAAAVRRIEKRTRELTEWPEAPGTHWVYHEKGVFDSHENLIPRIENIAPFHAGMAEPAKTLATPVGQLLDELAVLFKEKINFKLAGGGSARDHRCRYHADKRKSLPSTSSMNRGRRMPTASSVAGFRQVSTTVDSTPDGARAGPGRGGLRLC